MKESESKPTKQSKKIRKSKRNEQTGGGEFSAF